MKTTMNTENIRSTIVVDSDVWIRFTHEEAQLLTDIAGYGADAFLKVFKEKLESHYIEQHEASIKPLFDKLYQELRFHHGKVQAVRELVEKTKD